MNFFKKTKLKSSEPRILRNKSTRAASRKASSIGKLSIEPMQGHPQRPSLFAFTMLILYKNLYILGVTLMRRELRLKRRLKRFFSMIRGMAYARVESITRSLKRFATHFWQQSKAPFLRINRTYNEVKPDIAAKRARGKFPLMAYFAVIEAIFRLIFKILATIFNYTAPIAAVGLLIFIIGRTVNQPMVYTVQYGGEIIGYVENESEFNAATQDVHSRVTTDGTIAFEILNPHFELMTLARFEQLKAESKIPADAGLLERDELSDKLIRMSGSEVDEAFGLYIDNQFLGAVTNKNAVLNEFAKIKNRSYTGKPDETVKFVKSIRFKPGLYPKASITTDDELVGMISRNETSNETYIVKASDTPTGIADKTGVPYEVLKALNPEIEDKLFEGMEVLTQVARPFMSVQNFYTDVVEEEVPFETVTIENATYAKGYTDVFQTGVNGSRRVTYRVSAVDGLERERTEITAEIIKYPIDERVTVGINDPFAIRPPSASAIPPTQVQPSNPQTTPAPPPQTTAPAPSSGGFIRPVQYGVGYISCYLNGYWGHTGIDIAVMGGTGTPILASANGTVVVARNTGVGYGRYIIIDHGNGYQTLYAHNSALYVSEGQRVAQGQVIAAMGRTGNATGVHCHFEVKYNGKIMNPVNYIGSR